MATTIEVQLIPYVIALSGNPVNMSIVLLNDTGRVKFTPVTYILRIGGSDVFRGRVVTNGNGECTVQIGEILADFIPPPELDSSESEIIKDRPDLVYSYEIQVSADGCDPIIINDHKVMHGAINNRMRRFLLDRNLNVFTYKFLSKTGNFTTSTRNCYYISELMPVLAIGTGEDIAISGENGGISTTGYLVPYQIDLRLAADNVYEPTLFSIGGKDAWRVETWLNPDYIGEVFEFRNSFGVFERFLTTGKPSMSVDNKKKAEQGVMDIAVGVIHPDTDLPEWGLTKSVPTGYIHPGRMPGLISMLTSGEVYLLREDSRERVMVSCSDKIPKNIVEPISLTLSVSHVGPDKGYLPDLTEGEFGNPRLHTDNYNEQFN